MASSKDNSNGVIEWTGVALVCLATMGGLLWLVASHVIVYYLSPLLEFLSWPWYLVPGEYGAQVRADIAARYYVSRHHARHLSFSDWLVFCNVALRPWAIVFIGFMGWLFFRQQKQISSKRLNSKLSPTDLAKHMMTVFTDIAPVVAIQAQIISNKLKEWRRQTHAHEILQQATYQGKPILVPDTRESEAGQLVVDHARLKGYLSLTTKFTAQEGTALLKSPHLGRQLVHLIQDAKLENLCIPDRLSDHGKAIFAILAPFAMGAEPGKAQSTRVSDALNRSAYGSKTGSANLSVDEVNESFNQWREHPLIKRLAKIHNWEYTFLFALLKYARNSGKIGTWKFIWLRPMERTMYYALNTAGRKTPHPEAALAFSQFVFETEVAKKGRLPLTLDRKPVIFTDQVIRAFDEDWEFWKRADDDNEAWWKDSTGDVHNEAFIAELLEAEKFLHNLPPSVDWPQAA